MKANILMLLLLFKVSFLSAQNFDREKMDSLFTTIDQSAKGMGRVSVFHNSEEVYQKNYGYSDFEDSVKISPSTKFRIGSISKTFTATIIMKLIEDRKLSLTSKLSEFYPQIKNSEKITIKQLLQHRSGIENYTNATDYDKWCTEEHTKEQLLKRIASGKSLFEPDENFAYSNSNYVLLHYIAEDITSKSFSELLNEIIVKPCKLKNTYVGGTIRQDHNEAYSYMRLSSWEKETETNLSTLVGAGHIVSNPFDLNLFFHCLLSDKIVKQETLDQMFKFKDNFGLGVYVSDFDGMIGIGHSGGVDGFNSDFYYFPDQKIFIALSENGVVYTPKDIIIGVLKIYFQNPYQLPVFADAIEVAETDLQKYLGVYHCSEIPLKLTISNKGNNLIAQFIGQPSFPLEYAGGNKFQFTPPKITIEFTANEDKLIFKQQDMEFQMYKE